MLSLRCRLPLVALLVLSACSSSPAAPTGAIASGPPGSVPTVEPSDVDPWQRDASVLRGKNNQRYAYPCSPSGSESPVWGTDVYTDDSSVCNAGVHAGAISRAAGGWVVIEIRPGLAQYAGSERNGIASSSYAAWDGSYVVIKL